MARALCRHLATRSPLPLPASLRRGWASHLAALGHHFCTTASTSSSASTGSAAGAEKAEKAARPEGAFSRPRRGQPFRQRQRLKREKAPFRLPEKTPSWWLTAEPAEPAEPEGDSAPAGKGDSAPTGELVADVVYRANQQILLLGEADFSFAAALGRSLGHCGGLTATSYESRDVLLERFGKPFVKRVAAIEDQLCGVLYELPVAEVSKRFRPSSFDCVVFNFPLPGIAVEGGGMTAHAARSQRLYADLEVLLGEFFRGAAHVLRPGGECHLRMTDQYDTCKGLALAKGCGLNIEERVDFFQAFQRVYKPLGYRPASTTADGRSGRGIFNVKHASTLVFRFRPPVSL